MHEWFDFVSSVFYDIVWIPIHDCDDVMCFLTLDLTSDIADIVVPQCCDFINDLMNLACIFNLV